MPSYRNQLLARVNFPLYAVHCLTERHVLVAGGGGGAKTGIRNVIEIYELINNGSTCRATSVAHYETGSEAIMNCTIFNSGKYFILFAGMEGNCQVYKIKYDVLDDAKCSKDEASTSKSETLRQRTSNATSCKTDVPPSKSHLTCETSDSNANVIPSRLHFCIQRLECFQTDFSDEPFQKLVRFSSLSKLLTTAGADGHVRLWRYPALKQIGDVQAHSSDVDDLDICPLGKRIVSVSRDGHGKVWDAENGSLISELEYVLPPKSDGKYIFRSCRFGIVDDKDELALFITLNPALRKRPPSQCYICKYDTTQYLLQKIVSAGSDMLSAMAISDDGRFIGLGTQDGGVKIYIAFSLQVIYSIDHVHGIFVTGLEFLPTCEESRRITGGHEVSLVSISVDNHIIIHHIPVRSSMGILTLISLFILTLFFIFITMDFFNL